MTWDKVPWSIGNGAEHQPELLRLLAHAAVGAAEGVVNPGDCKVEALSVPTSKVTVAAGAVIMANRYAGTDGRQSYIGRNGSTDVINISPTGGSPRSDMIVARIWDPQYEGEQPLDPNSATYIYTDVIFGVPLGAGTFVELGLSYPGYALARIDIPANTSSITNGMIRNVRNVAQPRTTKKQFEVYPTAANDLTGAFSQSQFWPYGIGQTVYIPPWASVAILRFDLAGVLNMTANVTGGLRAELGRLNAEYAGFDFNYTGSPSRHTMICGATVDIPENMRGTVQNLRTGAFRHPAGQEVGTLRSDTNTALFSTVEFFEAAK